jgi:hypothetical protein
MVKLSNNRKETKTRKSVRKSNYVQKQSRILSKRVLNKRLKKRLVLKKDLSAKKRS